MFCFPLLSNYPSTAPLCGAPLVYLGSGGEMPIEEVGTEMYKVSPSTEDRERVGAFFYRDAGRWASYIEFSFTFLILEMSVRGMISEYGWVSKKLFDLLYSAYFVQNNKPVSASKSAFPEITFSSPEHPISGGQVLTGTPGNILISRDGDWVTETAMDFNTFPDDGLGDPGVLLYQFSVNNNDEEAEIIGYEDEDGEIQEMLSYPGQYRVTTINFGGIEFPDYPNKINSSWFLDTETMKYTLVISSDAPLTPGLTMTKSSDEGSLPTFNPDFGVNTDGSLYVSCNLPPNTSTSSLLLRHVYDFDIKKNDTPNPEPNIMYFKHGSKREILSPSGNNNPEQYHDVCGNPISLITHYE